ncbi:MAG: uroporphyrinogen decarboxylase family protein [Planctomycetota bacterium]
MFTVHHEPNFSRFRDTLLLRQAWRRPPQFDFHIADNHKVEVLGREPENADDQVEFFRRAGYDYVHAPLFVPALELRAHQEAQRGAAGVQSHGGPGIIRDATHYRGQAWSWQRLSNGDVGDVQEALDNFEQLAAALPDSMKLILHVMDVFTFAWEMIGFDEFCFASFDDPEWVHEVMDSLAAAVEILAEAAIARAGDRIGAVLYSDDIAYTEGLMLSPDFFREHLFPIVARLVQRGQAIDAPLIYHSDGRLYDVLNDLISVGVKGIQPLEPKSMEPLEIKRRWPGQVCLLGHIDLDLMARGTPGEVEAYVRHDIERLNADGGYIVGVSNTVPDYVRTDNYLRMIETIHRYPDEPIPMPVPAKGASA